MNDRQPALLEVPEAPPQTPLVEPPPPPVTRATSGLRDRDRRGQARPAARRPSLECPLSQMVLPGAAPEPEWQSIVRGASTPVEREAWPVVPWTERERQWRAHATSTGFLRRLEGAKTIAREGAAKGRLFVSLSGGKDSSALAGLLAEAGVSAQGVYASVAFDYPHTLATVDALGRAVGMSVTVLRPAELERHIERICKAYGRPKVRKRSGHRDYDEWDVLRALPENVIALDEGPMGHIVKALGHANMLTDHMYKAGYDGSFQGVRRLESLARHFNWRKSGAVYQSKIDGKWSCTPIVEWSGKDVWAFITTRNLPAHPFYRAAYETGLSRPDPGRIRTGALPYADIAAKGVLVPVARVYPDWWAQLTKYRPELTRYVEGRSQ